LPVSKLHNGDDGSDSESESESESNIRKGKTYTSKSHLLNYAKIVPVTTCIYIYTIHTTLILVLRSRSDHAIY